MQVRIETSRLILRAFEIEDASDLLAYLSQPKVNCFIEEKILKIEQAIEKIKTRQQSKDYLAVQLKQTNQVIGELFFIHEEPDTYSVGWNFNTAFHGQGFAYESTDAFLDHLFKQLNARRIYAYVEEDNHASQKLCERLGMRKEGCFVEYISFVQHEDGTPKYENTLQYAILKKEWLDKTRV